MVKVIVAREKLDCEHLLGQFLDESNYDVLIDEDTDCYLQSEDENNIAFKFRKNYFTKQEQDAAYTGLREAATPTQNRGLAAGPKGEKCGNREWVSEFQLRLFDFFKKEPENSVVKIDPRQEVEFLRAKYSNVDSSRGLVWLTQKVKENNFNFEDWLNKVLTMSVKERKEESLGVEETYISDTTYANVVNSGIAGWFDRYPRIPYGRATSYTQNHYEKFQMAFPFLQSLDRGFKQLVPWRWSNQRNVADKVDPAFLVPETVFTTITVNKTFRTAAHRDAGDFTDGLSNLLVEKMLELGSKEYEDHRFNYVECRRKDKEHPLQRKLWNGISPGMWLEQEWYDYLEKNGGREMVAKYHPEAYNKESTLDNLFG